MIYIYMKLSSLGKKSKEIYLAEHVNLITSNLITPNPGG